MPRHRKPRQPQAARYAHIAHALRVVNPLDRGTLRSPSRPELAELEPTTRSTVLGGRTEFDLEAIAVLEVGGVVAISSGERVAVNEHESPAVRFGLNNKPIEIDSCACMEREVVYPRPTAIVFTSGQGR